MASQAQKPGRKHHINSLIRIDDDSPDSKYPTVDTVKILAERSTATPTQTLSIGKSQDSNDVEIQKKALLGSLLSKIS